MNMWPVRILLGAAALVGGSAFLLTAGVAIAQLMRARGWVSW